MQIAAGTKLGRYEIRSQIGAGGMGEVFLAEDAELERKVALKILPAEVAADAERIRRFVQEARAASALNHPNILTIYEIGQAENSRFIATEFIAGETLRERLTGGALTLGETLDIAVQIASALQAAHRAGIVHRDIKPENIMRRDDGLIKVLDFGLAKLTEKKTERVESEDETRALINTAPGIIMGTAAYMSPEQARGRDTDLRSDIWSLGAVLYEMLAGCAPFSEETVSDTIAAILKTEADPLSENTPPELNRIVRKALQKNRDERYQTIKDFLLDVKNLKKELEFAKELERSQIPQRAKASNVGTNQPHENATAILPGAISTRNSIQPQVSSAEYIVNEVRKHKRGVALGSLILLALVGVGLWFFVLRPPIVKQIESIAVLPFVNESGNADTEYLSDGMTETLIGSLSQLPNLNVKARSSVFRYKGKEADAPAIGKELNVQAILNGRVVQRGDDLALYLELVDARTGNRIWGDQYNKKLNNLVSLQTEIARDVSQKLKTKLSGADEQKLAKNYTENAEAYKLYLQGRFYWNKRGQANLQKAIEYFGQAIAIDPNYALAHAGLADAYTLRNPALEMKPKAREAALKAVSLDDNLAEAHTSLGFVLMDYDFDFAGAEREYKRAIELDPNYATAHQLYSRLLGFQGRHDEANAEIRRALELDPLSIPINWYYGMSLSYARKYDASIAQLKKTIEIDPNFAGAYGRLSDIYALQGNYAEAGEMAAKNAELSGRPEDAAWIRGNSTRLGRQEYLRMIVSGKSPLQPRHYALAEMYAELGEKDKAFAELNKSYENRDGGLVGLKIAPRLDPLRDDPRYQELLRKVGFPQ